MAQSEFIIEIKHLSKSFDGVKVLEDINLQIRKGEFVTLLGPSGCGKTTLLRQIAGFLQPDEGRITMEGKDIDGIPPYMRPLNTVFQRYALFPHLDVYDNIAFGLKLNNVPEDEIEARVMKVLKLVSMNDYEDRDVNSLSGGQQQRIAIARMFLKDPAIIFLDEPTASLDAVATEQIKNSLDAIKKGRTVVVISHSLGQIIDADIIYALQQGHVEQSGTPDEVYHQGGIYKEIFDASARSLNIDKIAQTLNGE